MPIDPSLLIASPTLQDQLVDKDTGLPLAAGIVSLYQDNSRTTFKNWYYQSGSPGNYTYIRLPNPMTLSSAGTIVDNNGVDTIPFFYPVSEVDNSTPQSYYVVVQNSNLEQEFTRQNFPFVPPSGPPSTTTPTLANIITNGTFWRNIGTINASVPSNTFVLNGETFYYDIIAPSQHDGFSNPDIEFIKNSTDATDTVTFNTFILGTDPLTNGLTPEYYLNVNCSSAGTETSKYVQFPAALRLQNLSGVQASLVFWAQNNGGANPNLTISILEFLGSGTSSPSPFTVQTIVLTSGWVKYVIPFSFPDATGQVLASSIGGGSDDAYYIQFNFPTAATCNINIAGVALYLSTTVPTNEFQTYDQIGAVIDSPRTGDARISTNSFYPYGWIPANDGTIGNGASSASTRANADTWNLFSLLWSIAKPYDTNSNFNPICQLYTSTGAATNFGTSAINDFILNSRLALTRSFGRVILGSSPISSLLSIQTTTFTAANDGSGNLQITTANAVNFFNGMPIVFTNSGGSLPGNLVANAVYYVASWGPGSTTQFLVATSFANALSSTFIAYSSSGSGTNKITGGITGSSEGEYQHFQLVNELAQHTHVAASGDFLVNTGNSIQGGTSFGQIQADTGGITGYTGPLAFNVTQPGTFNNIFVKL